MDSQQTTETAPQPAATFTGHDADGFACYSLAFDL